MMRSVICRYRCTTITSVYFKRLTADDVEIEKSNIIMWAATGTGEDFVSPVPIAKLIVMSRSAIVDATVLTEAGLREGGYPRVS